MGDEWSDSHPDRFNPGYVRPISDLAPARESMARVVSSQSTDGAIPAPTYSIFCMKLVVYVLVTQNGRSARAMSLPTCTSNRGRDDYPEV